MDALHLIECAFPVEVGGRAFKVGRITLEAVLRILVRFDEHLRRFVSGEQPDALKLFESLDGRDLADLYSFLAEPHDAPYLLLHLDRMSAAAFAVAVGASNDLQRIWASLSLAPSKPADPAGPKPGDERRPTQDPLWKAVDRVARRYGIAPTSIPSWPYEAFLDALELCDAELEAALKALEANLAMPDGSPVDPDLLDDSDIPVTPLPDLNWVN